MTTLSDTPRAEPALDELLADLRELVECESPSDDLAAVERSADLVARIGTERLGVAPERIVVDGRTHLRWRLGRRGAGRVLVLGHHDTVWPLGTLAHAPVHDRRRRAARAGLLRHEGRSGDGPARPRGLADRDGVTLLVTGDEELGSPSSRELIEDEARRARGRARARGLGRRRRAQDRPQGRRRSTRSASPAGPRTPGWSREQGGQRDPRAGPPGAGGRGAGRPRCRHHGDAHASATSGTTANTVPAVGPFAVDVRAWTRVGAGARRRRDARRSGRCCPVPRLEVERRHQPAAAGGDGVGCRSSSARRRSPHGSGLPELTRAAVGRRVGRQLHRRRRRADPRRARRRRRRCPRRGRARARRPAGRPDPAARAALIEDLLTALVATEPGAPSEGDATEPLGVLTPAAAAASRVVVRELVDPARSSQDVLPPSSAGSGARPTSPPMSAELLRAMSKAGSYVAGAFDVEHAEAGMVGVCVGFHATPAARAMHSHIAGVAPTRSPAATSGSRSSCTSARGPGPRHRR